MSDEIPIVVAMLERAEGNESIGTAWIETAVFNSDATLATVLAWAESEAKTFDGKPRGKLMLRYASDQRAT